MPGLRRARKTKSSATAGAPAGVVVALEDRRPRPPADGAPPGLPELSESEFALAETLQALFLRAGRSLADPETAAVYRLGLHTCRILIDGALATGELSGVQHATLAAGLDDYDRVVACF